MITALDYLVLGALRDEVAPDAYLKRPYDGRTMRSVVARLHREGLIEYEKLEAEAYAVRPKPSALGLQEMAEFATASFEKGRLPPKLAVNTPAAQAPTTFSREWKDEFDGLLDDYEDAELPFPLDDMAAYISGDWGGSMAEARSFLEAARRIGQHEGAERSAHLAATVSKAPAALREAADCIERLSKACEAALAWVEHQRIIPGGARDKLRAELRSALGLK